MDQINTAVFKLNQPITDLRSNAQIHFSNSVRTLTESLHVFTYNANRAYGIIADVERSNFEECLVEIRDTMETILEFLRKKANSPVYDFSVSTVTRIESDLKSQTDELKTAIKSKTDAACLSKTLITADNIKTKYSAYSNNVTTCINALSVKTNTAIIQRFNPEHFPALALLNKIGSSLSNLTTRTQSVTFVSSHFI